jgi:hypothetical protein
MRKIGLWVLALCLTVGSAGIIGCGEGESTDSSTDTSSPDTGGDADDAAE